MHKLGLSQPIVAADDLWRFGVGECRGRRFDSLVVPLHGAVGEAKRQLMLLDREGVLLPVGRGCLHVAFAGGAAVRTFVPRTIGERFVSAFGRVQLTRSSIRLLPDNESQWAAFAADLGIVDRFGFAPRHGVTLAFFRHGVDREYAERLAVGLQLYVSTHRIEAPVRVVQHRRSIPGAPFGFEQVRQWPVRDWAWDLRRRRDWRKR